METHSVIPAWRIPMAEKPGRLQSMGSQRVGHNRATKHNTEVQKRRTQRRSWSLLWSEVRELRRHRKDDWEGAMSEVEESQVCSPGSQGQGMFQA